MARSSADTQGRRDDAQGAGHATGSANASEASGASKGGKAKADKVHVPIGVPGARYPWDDGAPSSQVQLEEAVPENPAVGAFEAFLLGSSERSAGPKINLENLERRNPTVLDANLGTGRLVVKNATVSVPVERGKSQRSVDVVIVSRRERPQQVRPAYRPIPPPTQTVAGTIRGAAADPMVVKALKIAALAKKTEGQPDARDRVRELMSEVRQALSAVELQMMNDNRPTSDDDAESLHEKVHTLKSVFA